MELREKILKRTQTTLGNEHPTTFHAMNILARSYLGLGRYQRAVELLEQVLEKRQRSLG
ncbi:hypothetical protein Egran_01024, partial [Elaphomyces granulatus]